jgi:6-phosphogluconate dehydrogenase
MGANLALNMERNGFAVAGYDRDEARTRAFLDGPARGRNISGVRSADELMAALEPPRRVLIMVPAGPPVDDAIAHLTPRMERGDVLIDGGNSWFLDTERRSKALAAQGFLYVGTGVSGGEEGALRGPSIMPGGPREAWELLAPILTAIAARADDGQPCVAYMGPGAAGHYVKMVHNGIEYGDMQLIAEAYDVLRRALGLEAREIAGLFARWNEGELKSYLVEISATVLTVIDHGTLRPLVDVILDEAQQKGTGKWMSQNALDLGAAIPTINAAVESRIISSLKDERVEASRVLRGPSARYAGAPDHLIDAVKDALYASKITSYAQGFNQLRLASLEYAYALDLSSIARIWRAGCIIRAALLGDIMVAYGRNPGLVNLLVDGTFASAIESRQQAWRHAVQAAVELGIPVPAMSASIAYYDAYRAARLPANLTQAQRDYFGAHTYRRIDQDGVFHTRWTDVEG